MLELARYCYLTSLNVAPLPYVACVHATSIGRIGKLECDFILRRGDSEYSYVQACMTMAASRETEDREYAPLSKIRDNYPKYILTRNDPIQKRDGIIHKNLPKFMAAGTMF